VRSTIRILALTSCAAVMSLGAARAQETPMQFWHQEWSRERHASVQQDYGRDHAPRWFGGDGYGSMGEQDNRRPRGPMPQVHVSNPTFYDYKPDALKPVSLDKLCTPPAPAQPPVAGTAGPETTGAAVADDQAPSSFAQACASLAGASLRMLPEVSRAVAAWYGAHPALVWSDGNGVSAKALAAIAVLNASGVVGLDPADYRVETPNLDGLDDQARQAALLRFDVALSAKALTYVLDAQRGRVDPDRISGYHDLPRKTVDLAAAMSTMTGDGDVAHWLQAQNPDNAQFKALVAELARLRADGPAPEPRHSGKSRHKHRDSAADKIAKVEMSLERLRWLPQQFGDRYVFLNQPAFEVTYFNGNDKPLSMRAVVGRPDAQTYFFVDHIKDVQYNPYWNVPRSIVVNEMLPKLYRDGSYLDDHGYEVLNQRGRQIASNSVDWAAFAKNAASVEVRQPPGRRNALGLVKIEFPNKHAIYMHDTPEKSFFTRDMRALSHGCVRLQHPKEMAAALLGKSVGYVEKQIARGENASERVGADIPVYLAYFTAWPDPDGAVRYYGDVYDRDAHLKTALEKTEAARKDG